MNEIKKIVGEIEDLAAEKVAIAEREKDVLQRLEAAREENEKIHAQARASVEDTCAGRFFCGVILSDDDVVNLLKVAMNKPEGESIKIPFQLYPIEEIHDCAKGGEEALPAADAKPQPEVTPKTVE